MSFFPARIDKLWVHKQELNEIRCEGNSHRVVWNNYVHEWVLLWSDLYTVPVCFRRHKTSWCIVSCEFEPKKGMRLVF